MKTNTNKKMGKLPVILSCLTLLVIVFSFYAFVYNRGVLNWLLGPTPGNSTINYDPPTEEQIKAGQEAKEAGVDKATNNQPSSNLEPIITSANQNGSLFQLRVLVDNVLGADSTCTLEMSHDEVSVKRTVDMQTLASSSTCKGFDVPVSELGAGTWRYTVSVDSAQANGSVTGLIEIN